MGNPGDIHNAANGVKLPSLGREFKISNFGGGYRIVDTVHGYCNRLRLRVCLYCMHSGMGRYIK